MKIEFSLEAETAADMLTALQNFVHAEGIGEKKKSGDEGTPAGKAKTPAKEPAKKAAPKITEDDLREKLSATEGIGWTREDMKAFTVAFGKENELKDEQDEPILRIPQVPAGSMQDYLDKLQEVIDMSPKARKAYLATASDEL